MASTTTIGGIAATSTGSIIGTTVVEIEVSATSHRATLAQLRTQMFAGGTGFTPSDPLAAGDGTLSTLRVGNGTATLPLVATANATVVASDPDVVVHVVGSDVTNALFVVRSYGGSSHAALIGYHARGTAASPTTVNSGDALIVMAGRGYDGTSWTDTRGEITVYAGSTWSSTDRATYITMETTLAGTVSRGERLRIHTNGMVGVNQGSPTHQLEVGGTFAVAPGVGADAIASILAAPTTNAVVAIGNSSGTNHWYLSETVGVAGAQGTLRIRNAVSGVDAVTFDTSATPLASFTGAVTVTGAATFNGGATVASGTLTTTNLILTSASASGSASAGSGSALPAAPDGYLILNINGSNRKIAYYPP